MRNNALLLGSSCFMDRFARHPNEHLKLKALTKIFGWGCLSRLMGTVFRIAQAQAESSRWSSARALESLA